MNLFPYILASSYKTVLLLSFGGPLNLPIGGVEKAVLAVMHLVTAVAIVVILSALARKQ